MESSRIENAELLSVRADLMRSRLARTLSAIGRRRREALDVPLQVKRHLGAVAVVAGVLLTGVVVVEVFRATNAAKRRRRARWLMLGRMWTHPEQAAPPKPSILGGLARALVLGVGRILLTRLLAPQDEAASTPRAAARLNP